MKQIPQHEVELAMKRFDFTRVHKAMIALNWGWAYEYKNLRVPSLEDIKATALDLLTRVAAGQSGSISTGGFSASRVKRGDDSEYLLLEFIVEHADSEYID